MLCILKWFNCNGESPFYEPTNFSSFYLFILFTYLFRKHKYKFTNTSLQIQVIILNKNMFAGGL